MKHSNKCQVTQSGDKREREVGGAEKRLERDEMMGN